jgi:hypothetical protein
VARRFPLSQLGYFRQEPLPQDPVPYGIAQLLSALKGPPGIRLAATNSPTLRYSGTDLIPPSPNVPQKVNQPNDLEQAVLQAETYGPGVSM